MDWSGMIHVKLDWVWKRSIFNAREISLPRFCCWAQKIFEMETAQHLAVMAVGWGCRRARRGKNNFQEISKTGRVIGDSVKPAPCGFLLICMADRRQNLQESCNFGQFSAGKSVARTMPSKYTKIWHEMLQNGTYACWPLPFWTGASDKLTILKDLVRLDKL